MAKNDIKIIYQNSEFFLINKPAGISVTADRTGQADILTILRKQLCEEYDLRLVHRLDKFTSGVMLVAKTAPAQSKFSRLFAKRLVSKTYLGLVSGVAAEHGGSIDAPISRSRSNDRVMQIDRKRGKEALSSWELLADFGMLSLVAIRPITDRTHQIRVHLASIGLPLAIDPLYGGSRGLMLSDFKSSYSLGKGKTERPLIERLTLHSYQLEIPSGDSGKMTYIAGLDKKFTATIKMLAKHNPNGAEAFVNPDNLGKILNAEPIC